MEGLTIQELKKVLLHNATNHKKEILKCETIKDAHIYCKINGLNGQRMGPLIEYYIKEKSCMEKNKASDCIGDCRDRFLEDNEIKASISGDAKNKYKYNYVQIRLNHKIHNYILTAYYLTDDNVNEAGELFIFKIKKEDIIQLIFEHGGYAHGCNSKLGKIKDGTIEDLKDESNSKEYTLRPLYGDALWEKLLKYRVNESDL